MPTTSDMILDGRVALITGGARGQGRSHAVALAAAGAHVAILDSVTPIATVAYELPTADDLAETVRAVEAAGRRCIAATLDVRDLEGLTGFAERTVRDLGRLDIVVANAGIHSAADVSWELTADQWHTMIDINLTGVWNTCKATIPEILRTGDGGSLTLISSTAGSTGFPGSGHYTAAKHGIVGLMRSLAIELAPHSVRVNSLHPTSVNTPMAVNDSIQASLDRAERFGKSLQNLLPVELLEPADISAALLWLVSPAARYVTGTTLTVDAGFMLK